MEYRAACGRRLAYGYLSVTTVVLVCYPNMPIGKVWIYRLLFVCLFVRLRISPPRIKLAASNFARRFIGIPSRESSLLGKCAPQEAQNRTNRPIVCSLVTTRLAHHRPAQVARALNDSSSALTTRRIGMCRYAAVSEYVLVFLVIL